MLRLLAAVGRAYRAVGRKLVCTCPDPAHCPMFGTRLDK